MGWLREVFVWLWDQIILAVTGIAEALWSLVLQLVDWLVSQLPTGLGGFLGQRPWESFYSYLDGVNWFLPIYPALGIVATAYAFIGGVRLFRWVKSFIPTISG